MAGSHHNRRNCIKRIPALRKLKSLPMPSPISQVSTFNLPCINVFHNCNPCIKKKSCLGLRNSHCLCSISQKHTQIKFIVLFWQYLIQPRLASNVLRTILLFSPPASVSQMLGSQTCAIHQFMQCWELHSCQLNTLQLSYVANPKWWLLCFT